MNGEGVGSARRPYNPPFPPDAVVRDPAETS